jgi:TonB family protein
LNNLELNIKKILLGFKYDTSKTLSENKKIILNEVDGEITYTLKKNYSLETLGVNWVAKKNTTFTQFPNEHSFYNYGDTYHTNWCPGPDCVSYAYVNELIGKQLVTFWCDTKKLYTGEIQIFSNKIENDELIKELSNAFCKGESYPLEPYQEIVLQPSNIEQPNNSQQAGTNTNQGQMTKKEMEQLTNTTSVIKFSNSSDFDIPKTEKTPEEIRKELLNNPNVSKMAPRLYVSSLGFNEWKKYQTDFCCPTKKENEKENIICNQNIGKAFENGYRPGDPIPENLKSYYCKDNTGNVGSSSGEKITDQYGHPEPPKVDQITGVSEAQFDGSISDWFNLNFKYPSDAESKGIEGTVDVSFTVDTDGNIKNVESTSDVDESLRQNAIDLVKKMPKWVPSNKDGVNIESKVTLPIEYFLGFE